MRRSVTHIIESTVPEPGSIACNLGDLFEFQRGKGWDVCVVSRENLQEGSAAINRADFIHVHGLWSPTAGHLWPILKRSRKRYVVSTYAMNMPGPQPQGRWSRVVCSLSYQNALLRRAWCLHALTRDEYTALKAKRLNRRVKVIPFGVRAPSVDESPVDSPPAGLGGKRVILYMGRLQSSDGLTYLLKAAAMLADRYEDLHVVLAGPAETDWTASFAADQRLQNSENRVTTVTAPSPEQMSRLLAGAMIVALPAPGFCCPVSALQAMAAGKPVVITQGCGLEEVEIRGAGWIVDVQRGALLEVIGEAFDKSVADLERMGKLGQEIVRDRYSWDRLGPEYLNLYAKGLDRPDSAL